MKNNFLIFSMIFSLIFLAMSCQKDSHNVKTNQDIVLDKKISDIKFFLRTTLNVQDNQVIYNTQTKEFEVFNLKYPLADIEKRYNNANEFKLKYGLK